MERSKHERGVIEMVDAESLAPAGLFLCQVNAAVDFEKLYEIVEPLYNEEEGGGALTRRHLCTRSISCVKTVLRHIRKDYEELSADTRCTPEYGELYMRRRRTFSSVV